MDVAASPGLPSVLSTVLSTIGHAKALRRKGRDPMMSTVLSTIGHAKVEGHAKEGEPAASTPWSPEVRREFEQKAREMRLYAAGLEVLDGRYLRRCE